MTFLVGILGMVKIIFYLAVGILHYMVKEVCRID